jgi:hypothetical protein
VFEDGAQPYAGWNNTEVMVHVQAGRGISRPAACTEAVFQAVVAPCFSANPDERPKFAHMARKLKPFIDAATLESRAAAMASGFRGGQTPQSSMPQSTSDGTPSAGLNSDSNNSSSTAHTLGMTTTTYVHPEDDAEIDEVEFIRTHSQRSFAAMDNNERTVDVLSGMSSGAIAQTTSGHSVNSEEEPSTEEEGSEAPSQAQSATTQSVHAGLLESDNASHRESEI